MAYDLSSHVERAPEQHGFPAPLQLFDTAALRDLTASRVLLAGDEEIRTLVRLASQLTRANNRFADLPLQPDFGAELRDEARALLVDTINRITQVRAWVHPRRVELESAPPAGRRWWRRRWAWLG